MVLSWSMDKPGPMCRSIEDVALVFNVVHGADPKDPATVTTPFEFRRLPNLNGIRVGYAPNSPEAFLNDLRAMGATVSPLPTLPNITSPSIGVEGAAAMESYIDEKLRLFEENGGDPVPTRFQNGRTPTALEYLQAQRRRWLLMQQWDELLQGLDVYVGGLGASNQTGHPAVVLPYTFGSTTNAQGVASHEQPRCVTIFGPVFSDDALLSVAQAYQIQHDWHTRRPTIPLG
jgi:Asp-tRNA(Asn)/Glu-tRNA(Gln) amidotransferase A subunit family amidase